MISSITRLRILGLSLLLAVTMLPATATAQTRPSIAGLQAQIAALQANNVPGLASYLSVDTSTPARPVARFHGVNVQIVDDLGAGIDAVNGLGNLIVGYDEVRTEGVPVCSWGVFTSESPCVAAGGTWSISHKSGSHNVVIGTEHNYSRGGSLVAGYRNTINGDFATVSGGTDNTASGYTASVSGGTLNTASGDYSSVSGGDTNTASGRSASVSGGTLNTASAGLASVSGGTLNTASGLSASISGGDTNTASGPSASVSGGDFNIADGSSASVSGGQDNTASGDYSSVSGGIHNAASEYSASVSGGNQNKASGYAASVSGGDTRSAIGSYNWVAGALFQDQ